MPSVKSILLLDLITVLSEGNLELIYIYIYNDKLKDLYFGACEFNNAFSECMMKVKKQMSSSRREQILES
jgi:hypothetical protein